MRGEPPSETRTTPQPRRDWPWLILILAIGAGLRLWYLTQVMQAPDFAALRQDLHVQDYQARAMISGDWTVPDGETDPEIPTTPYYRPPGYPYYLAVIYYFSDGSYLAPRIVNMLMGLCSVLLMYALAKRLYGRGPGLLTAFFMAMYWAFIYYEGEVNDPSVFVFLVPALFLVLRSWSRKMTFPRAAVAGLIIGAYALMRPNILLFGPVLALWMFWLAARRHALRRIFPSWLGLLLATFLVILPVTVRNYKVSGEFVPISTYFGENFLIGNDADSDGVTSWTPYLQDLEGTGNWSVWVYINVVKGLGRELGREVGHAEASNYFFWKTVDFIKDHKLRTLELTLRKAALFWTPVEITENKVVQCEKDFYPPLKYLPGFTLVMALFAGGLLMQLVDLRRGRFPDPGVHGAAKTTEMTLLVYAFMFVYFASFLPFFVNARARVPILGLCLMIGAYGLWRLGQRAASRQTLPVLASVALYAAMYVLASIQWVPYEPDRCRWHYDRADCYLRTGHVDLAVEEASRMMALPQRPMSYMPFRLGHAFAKLEMPAVAAPLLEAALSPDPGDQNPRYRQDLLYHLGAQFAKLDRDDEAMAAFRQALELNPDDARAQNDLALLLEKQDRLDEAEQHYREAIRAYPDFGLALSNLGDLLARRGRVDQAIDLYRQAVLAEPDAADFHYNLARHLAAAGNVEQAIAEYRTAIGLADDDPRPHNNLGLLLAQRGQLDDARGHFQEALRIAPDFTLAHANLGDLCLREGKNDEALAAYEQGLATNPGDAGLHNATGYLYAQKGDAQQAREHYGEALRIAPDFPAAHLNLGNLEAAEGKLDAAVEQYRVALESAPGLLDARVNLGIVLAAQGRTSEAKTEFEAALQTDPNCIPAQQQLERLTAPGPP
jgi:tetratricopeptide (TPR) repeat protein